MASPQLENGYLRIANELWEALNRSSFSGVERRCIDLVIRLSYGCGKKYAVLDKWSDLEIVGIGAGHIKGTVVGLLKKRVLKYKKLKVEGKARPKRILEITKDYTKWGVDMVKGPEYKKLIAKNIGLAKNAATYIRKGSQSGRKGGSPDLENFPNGKEKSEKVPNREEVSSQTGTSSQPKPTDGAALGDPKDSVKDRREKKASLTPSIYNTSYKAGWDIWDRVAHLVWHLNDISHDSANETLREQGDRLKELTERPLGDVLKAARALCDAGVAYTELVSQLHEKITGEGKNDER